MKRVIIGNVVYFIIIISSFFLCGCSGEVSNSDDVVVSMIFSEKEAINRLTTLKYTTDELIFIQGEKGDDTVALLLTHPSLELGVDFKKLKKDDISINNDTISIKMPEVTVTNFRCNPLDREIIFDKNGYSSDYWDKKMKEKMYDLQKTVEQKAKEKHLFERAENNVAKILNELFKKPVVFEQRSLELPSIE